MKGRIAALAAAVALLAAAGPARAATPPPLTVTALGETVRAKQGSFCWSGKGRTPTGMIPTICGDYHYPLEVKCRLPVAPGVNLKVRTGAAVRVVSVALIASITDEGPQYLEWEGTRRSRKGDKTWRFTLPPEIGQAAVLDIFIAGRRGDSNTWTGLATQPCAALPPVG